MDDVVTTQQVIATPGRVRSLLARLYRLALDHPHWPYWVGLCLAFEVLYRRLPTATEKTLQSWFNSDWTFAADAYNDIFVNHFPLSGIKFSIAPALFPDVLFTSSLMFVTNNAALATFLCGLVQFTLLVMAYMFCAHVVQGRRSHAASPCVLMLAIGLVLYVSSILQSSEETLYYLFRNSSHVSSFVVAVFCGSCSTWLCFHSWRGWRAKGAVCALAGLSLLGTMSDLMFIPYMLVAFTLAVIVLGFFGVLPPRRPWAVLAIAWPSSLFGIVLVRSFFDSERLGAEAALSSDRVNTAFDTFRTGFYDELSKGDWLHVAALVWIISAGALIFYTIHRKPVQRHRFEEMPESAGRFSLLILFLLISSVGSVVAVVLMGISGLAERNDYLWSMHYESPLFFGGVFGLAVLADLLLERKVRALKNFRWVPACVSLLIPLVMLSASPKPKLPLGAYSPLMVKALDSLAPQYGLQYGVGGFWQFRSVNLFSRAGLRTYPIRQNLEPLHWLSNKYWYAGYPGSRYAHPVYNFIILDDPLFKIPREVVVARFGEPAAEVKMNDVRLLVYNRSSDERFHNFFACSIGLASLLHPLNRPGDRLDVMGDCLPGLVGGIEGSSRVARQGQTSGGLLSFGPYVPLKIGIYSAVMRCKISGPVGQHEASWDLGFFQRDPRVLIRSGTLETGQTEVRATFRVAAKTTGRPLEMRVFYNGVGEVLIENMVVEKTR